MARINNLTNFITDIANAIKYKANISTTITPANFDTLINNIETGVDVSDSTVEASDVAYGKIFYTSNGVRTVGTYVPENLNPELTGLEGQVAILQNALANKTAGPINEPEYFEAVEQVEELLGDSNE